MDGLMEDRKVYGAHAILYDIHCVPKCKRGLTLVELLVATAVVALVFTAVCGVYFAVVTNGRGSRGS